MTTEPTTLLEALKASLEQAGRHNPADTVAPAAILWPDPDGQWMPLIRSLRPLMPALLTLGDHEPADRTGPAIWLRCMIEGALPDAALPDETIPVIYLPGVGRQELRAVEQCPDTVKPLVELQFRGATWAQKNGKDWTAEAFLVSDSGGLALDLSRDQKTRQAMLGSLVRLAVTPVSSLRGRRLEAEDFDRLMIGDPPRDLLQWLGDPEGTRGHWDESTWAAFRSRCRADYGFDPASDGEIVGGEKLGMCRDAWVGVWQRYCESPALYAGIPELLSRAKPASELFVDPEHWPDENDKAESALRKALLALGDVPTPEARETIARLEKEHGPRRGWVWAALGRSPLAQALGSLAVLGERTENPLAGESTQVMAEQYAEGAYLADDAVLSALASAKRAEDVEAVSAAIRTLYLPWLDDCARHFQECLAAASHGSARDQDVSAGEGECLLFADGLRYDIAQRLLARVQSPGLKATATRRWAALPTVTSTAKPAVSPIAERLTGSKPGTDFIPTVEAGKQELNQPRFRKLLEEAGYQVLDATDLGDPGKSSARAWAEYGEFDSLGHKLQAKMASRIGDQIDLLADRIEALIDAGWKCVRVVTDHGWLLVPGGLPVVQIPKYLTESRWARCASIKQSAHVKVPAAPWHWNPHEYFAHGPGVSCFFKGSDYAHGGVSLQECLIPDLVISAEAQVRSGAIPEVQVRWAGLRCRVETSGAAAGLSADLRTKPADPSSSILPDMQAKTLDMLGQAGLLVEDDSLEGTIVSLVLLGPDERVLIKIATTVGGEE